MIYIGPTNIKKGLRCGMGFRGGLTADVAEKAAACPALLRLIVPPESLTAARKETARTGSALHQAYIAATEYLNKESD